MKRETIQKRVKIANDMMYYIYKYIDSDINLDELSHKFNISKFHLHRIFKDEFKKNIYESIKSIRLQKASNLLITNRYSTISDIAKLCGYSSQSSFIRAFKSRFEISPKLWRNEGYIKYSNKILESSKSAINSTANFSNLEPKIVKMPEMRGYYIRHQGYNRSIKNIWQKLLVWVLSNDIKEYKEIGLHHDNPIITPLHECQYIATIVPKDEKKLLTLPTFTIPSGIYARFDISGKYGDVLKFIQWVYHSWLIESGYETTTNPSFAIYEKNHFLSDDEKFILQYFIPITYV